jgi:hypothetical protein
MDGTHLFGTSFDVNDHNPATVEFDDPMNPPTAEHNSMLEHDRHSVEHYALDQTDPSATGEESRGRAPKTEEEMRECKHCDFKAEDWPVSSTYFNVRLSVCLSLCHQIGLHVILLRDLDIQLGRRGFLLKIFAGGMQILSEKIKYGGLIGLRTQDALPAGDRCTKKCHSIQEHLPLIMPKKSIVHAFGKTVKY